MDVKSVRNLVKWVLENEVETRNDDDLLVSIVDAKTNPAVLNAPYTQVMKNRAAYHLFPVESITRARRVVQEQNKELMAGDWVARRRARKEKEYRDYFREEKSGKR